MLGLFGRKVPTSGGITDQHHIYRDVDRWFLENVLPYEGLFLTIAKNMVNDRDLARDLLHESYAYVLSKGLWRQIANPKAYLIRTIKSLSINALRRRRVVPMVPLSDAILTPLQDETPDAQRTVSGREALISARQALEKLPPRTREVLLLRNIEGLSAQEISRKLGTDESLIRRQVKRGIFLMTQYMEEIENG